MQYSENNNIKADAQADTFVSAKWNIQICQSGDIDGSKTIYPFGKKMRKNAILDNWLRSVILLFQQTQSNVETLDGSANMRELTRGYIQLGTGIKPISYADTQLSSYVRESDYIRPFYGFETGYGIIESGAAIFRRSYDFLPEVKNITYTEAGFRPYASSLISDNTLKNKIWSRFLFTAETGAVGFLSGYIDNSGVFRMFDHEIDHVSGVFVTGDKYNISPFKTRKNERIIGFVSGFRYPNGQFSGYTSDIRYNLSGYFISGAKYNFNPITEISNQPITGYISGYADEFGNFSGFNNRSISGGSGYFIDNNIYKFRPDRYFESEVVTGFISGSIDKFNNFSGYTNNPASGYIISGNQYNFPTGNMFSGFSGQEYFYNDWGYNYSGFNNINSGFSGENKFNEKIVGYISGYLNSSGVFSGLHQLNPLSGSTGYFIDGTRFVFPSVGFNNFENQSLFNKNIGYNYTGFNFVEGSGFSGIEFGDSGLCTVTGSIGDRNYYTGNGIYTTDIGSRILLTYSGEFNGFDGEIFTQDIKTHSYSGARFFISGTSGFSGIGGSTSGYGILTGLIGSRTVFYKSGQFEAFENNQLFQEYLGYKYTGFSFPQGSGFSGVDFLNSGHGIITGFIGDRNTVNFSGAYSGLSEIPTHEYGWYYTESGFFGSGLPNFTGVFTGGKFDISLTGFSGTPFGSGEKIVGFISGYVNELNNFVRFDNVNVPNFTGYSGYYTENKQRFFPTGNLFSGFSGQSGFDTNLQYRFTGFSFPEGSGFSGNSWPVIQKENVVGFMSGFMTEVQQFIPFQNLYPELSSTGYYISGTQRFFPTGNLFSGFAGQSGIDPSAYEYSGFFLSGPSGFSGANFIGSGSGILTGIIGYRKYPTYPFSGSGVITGYIGDRNVLKYSNTGILTGLIGYKDYISGVQLEYGQFVRVTYEVMSRIPMLTGAVQVTGANLVDGSFNASGQLKLIGLYEYIFGYWNMRDNGRHTENPFVEGFWWPSNPVHCFRDWPPGGSPCPYPGTHLSANLIESGYGTFPPINQVRSLPAVNFNNDEGGCILTVSRGPDCSEDQPYTLDIRKRVRWSSRGEIPDDGNDRIDSRVTIYPVVKNGLLQETYDQNTKPAHIDIKIIFPAEYPNADVAINGIFISPSIDECVFCDGFQRCVNESLKPYSTDPEWLVYPCKPDWTPDQGDYHTVKNQDMPAIIKAQYGISGRQGVGWAYLFNTPQMKYEDQKIEVDFRFSMLRDIL